jgi:hypothetical protein
MREWVHGLFGPDAVKGQTVRREVLTGHDDIDEPRTDLHYPGRSPWV